MDYQKQLERVENEVLNYFQQHSKPELVYHQLGHTRDVVDATKEIANHYQLSDADFFIVMTGAWFHDLGYLNEPARHEEAGAMLAEDFLQKQGVKPTLIEQVKKVIMATRMPQQPQNLLEKILCDADLFHLGTTSFSKKRKLLHKEVQWLSHTEIGNRDWRKRDICFLENHFYHTAYASLLLNEQKALNLDKLKEKDQELNEAEAVRTQEKPSEQLLSQKDKNRPEKGIETMFRITSSNNQRLSDMADNKAQLLITVNSIILSLIVSLVLRRLEDNVFLVIPTFILLLVSLSTIVFSILATRPSIPSGTFSDQDLDRKKINLLFFGNFYKMPLEEYSKGMIRVMNDTDFLYGTLITDVYSQGVVLGRKYKLIRIAYNIFMFGLITAVVAYVSSYIGYGKLN